MIFIGESYLFDFSIYMQPTQSALKVLRSVFLEEQSPRLWVRQEIVYMHWYSLWAQRSSSHLMSVCWFVRAKSQCDDCVVLGFFPVPGVCEKWSTHAAQVQKNIQTASEFCKLETRKRWKNYLNEVWMWIQMNICRVVQTQCLWLSLMVFTTEVLQKAEASAAAFTWWLYLIVQELRKREYVYSELHFFVDAWCSCGQNIFWNSEYVHRSWLWLVCDCQASIFTLSVTWQNNESCLSSSKAAFNLSSAPKPSDLPHCPPNKRYTNITPYMKQMINWGNEGRTRLS